MKHTKNVPLTSAKSEFCIIDDYYYYYYFLIEEEELTP